VKSVVNLLLALMRVLLFLEIIIAKNVEVSSFWKDLKGILVSSLIEEGVWID
jgi:hypothetical protein